MRSVLRLFAIILSSTLLLTAQSVRSQGPVSTPPPSQNTAQSTSDTQHHSGAKARRHKKPNAQASAPHRKTTPRTTKPRQPQEDITVPLSGKSPAVHTASAPPTTQPVLGTRLSPAGFAAAGFATLALGLLGRPYRAFQCVRDRANDGRK